MSKFIALSLMVGLVGYYAYDQSQPAAVAELPESVRQGYAVVYFGTKDCPACKHFTRNYMSDVEGRTGRLGIPFIAREIDSLRGLRRSGSFGEFYGLWRAASAKVGYGVPSFAFVKDGRVMAVSTGNWDPVVTAAARDKFASN